MPKYECPNCQGVFCGWAIKYKYKNRCPGCGGELREVFSDDQKYPDNRKHKENIEEISNIRL